MIRLFLITILTCSSILKLISQEYVLETKNQDLKKQIVNENSINGWIYYLINTNADSTIFLNDSIVLSKKKNNKNPIFSFKEDSIFNFAYNFRLDTVTTMNSETGEIFKTIILKSEKINGRWESDNPGEYIEIILENDEKLRYILREVDNKIYFIKQ
jgi:hypothetical protein